MEEKVKRHRTIYQDQRVAEEFCNFRCDYCEGFAPSEYSLCKDANGNLKVAKEWFEKIENLPIEARAFFKNGRKMEDFYKLSARVIDKSGEVMETDILKISGGEVTTNKQLAEFIEDIHNKYFSVQILTNGFNLSKEDVNEYKKMGNVSFQISIDGATAKSNYAKSHNAKVTEKVLKNIEYLIEQGIGVEINCVLTKYNTGMILQFLERFKEADNFIIVPRPVRGKPKDILNFSKEQIIEFERIVEENFEEYSNILPPKKYMDRLIEIMKNDKRNTPCYIPHFVQSIDGYGNFEQCPIGLINDINYNILDKTLSTSEKSRRLNEYHIFDNVAFCKNCTNQYEMFNLYVEGEISKEELKKMPSLNSDIIISHIDEIKDNLIKSQLMHELKNKYNLESDVIEKSEESTDGNVYIIHSGNEKFVAKLYSNIDHTDAMIKLHTYLDERNFNVPKVITSKDNKKYAKIFNKYFLVVYSFLEGKQIGWNPENGKLNKDIVVSVARMLRELHRMTNNYELGLPHLPFKDENQRKSVVHFDLTRNNIFNNNGEIGLIDFDDAKYGDSICDVSILICNLFFSKTRGVDLEGMNIFIDSYYDKEVELMNREKPKIKEYALKWIEYILNGNEFDTSTTESFEIRRDLIEKSL